MKCACAEHRGEERVSTHESQRTRKHSDAKIPSIPLLPQDIEATTDTQHIHCLTATFTVTVISGTQADYSDLNDVL